MKSGSWKLSNGFEMLNYTSQWSSHWNSITTESSTRIASFRHSALSIATLRFIDFWPKLLIKIKVLTCLRAIVSEKSKSSAKVYFTSPIYRTCAVRAAALHGMSEFFLCGSVCATVTKRRNFEN